MNIKLFFINIFIFFFAYASVAAPAISPNSGAIQGRILKPDSTPVDSASVDFTLQVLSPNADACILYEETHNLDMSAGTGLFSLSLGGGTLGGSDPGIGYDQSFNR